MNPKSIIMSKYSIYNGTYLFLRKLRITSRTIIQHISRIHTKIRDLKLSRKLRSSKLKNDERVKNKVKQRKIKFLALRSSN